MSTESKTIDLSKQWKFAYRGDADDMIAGKALLPVDEVQGVMQLPGFWDDHLSNLRDASGGETLRENSEYQPIRMPMENPPPDATLPYVVGVGQYETTFAAPDTGGVTFTCGPVFLEAWLWLDGRVIAHQSHYSTPWSVSLDAHITHGTKHRLTLQLANTQPRTMGCITRGFKGYSAGIAGPILLRLTGSAAITDVYVYPCAALKTLHWSVQIECRKISPLQLQYRVIDSATDEVVLEGQEQVEGDNARWTSDAESLRSWSDDAPNLYTLEVTLHDGEVVCDHRSQSFGLRRLVPEGFNLKLNGRPIFLRGATEHAYFPATCNVPLDKAVHRQHIAKLKELEIETGHALNLDAMARDSGVMINPVVEIVSSFKAVKRQAALLEFNVGSGRLMVCTLGLTPDDPAAAYLFSRCIDYLHGSSLEHAVDVEVGAVRQWILQGVQRQALTSTDQGFDVRANVAKQPVVRAATNSVQRVRPLA